MAIAIAVLTSCDVTIDTHEKTSGKDSTAVGFSAYVKRDVSTKAGMPGELTDATIKDADAGFGVFGFAGNGGRYHEALKPDFMYNQPVKFQSGAGKWTYSPVKYWPNETGEDAQSAATQRLSFFAYAPYVQVTPSTGLVTENPEAGIIGMTHYLAAGDPQVQYRTSLIPGKDVDLCWGFPFIDAVKPLTGDRLRFEFHHALAQLNVQIDTDMDVASQGAEETRIYVRSVTFNGFATKGSLNLNNAADTPSWYDMSGVSRLKREPVTIYDGRIDGAEGVAGSIDSGEKLATLNPAIVQSEPYDPAVIDGVTATAVNLFRNSDIEAPVLVVPLTGTPLTVTVVYDVETADAELVGRLSDGVTHGISVENQITKEVTLSNGAPMTLSAGFKYTVHLHLGLSGVKFNAEVVGWDDNVEYAKTDLPDNKATFDIRLTERSATRWIAETTSLPTMSQNVKIIDQHGDDVTSQASLSWTSDNTAVAIAETDGSITLGGSAGVAHIEITATYDGYTKSAVYTVNVNEVTGVSISPSTTSIAVGGSREMTATIEHTKYGAIAALPLVSWSSDYAKVVVDPEEVIASTAGSATVAATMAMVGSDAELGHGALITAKVGAPFASSDVSGTATLTCKDSRVVASVVLGAPSTTVWIGQGATIPAVTVLDEDDNPLPEATCAWTSGNEAVASVSPNGVITLNGAGTAVLTVTARYNNTSASAYYTVNVNEVTGLQVSAPSSSIYTGRTRDLTATITHTNNGSITTFPAVAWSSDYDKVTVDPSSVAATKVGSATKAATTATAAADAEFERDVVITATIGTDFAPNEVSGSKTLTIKDSRTVASVTLSAASTTVWKGQQGVELPTYSVTASDGSDLTTLAICSWRANTDIATLKEDGGINPFKGGVATFTLSAEYNGTLAQEDFTVYVNEVTGISVSPASVSIDKGNTTTLTAQLTKTTYGDYASLTDPTISWTSASSAVATVPSGATGTSVEVTGAGGGTTDVTASIPESYLAFIAIYPYASCSVTCLTPHVTSFRGYEVSPGILVRNKVGDADATYSLTDGSKPFELYSYYGQSESVNKYYLQWTTLKSELQSDGDNIKADSDGLPTGWQMPGYDVWETILHGEPLIPTKVNGKQILSKAVALVSVENGNGGYYYGMLLIRDGADIPSGYLDYVGNDSRFARNKLTLDQFNTLRSVYHCVFLSLTGSYLRIDGSWRDAPTNTSTSFGRYLTRNFRKNPDNIIEVMVFQDQYPSGVFSGMSGYEFFLPVRLVHPVTDN